MSNYFETLTQDNGYLMESPRKQEVLRNAKHDGNVFILPNSNNRALVIEDANKTYLQSYDTLILETDKETRETVKLWDGYSATTMKHINEYLYPIHRITLNKKAWEKIEIGGKI